jgi:anti-anti-sigma regulatory factor
VPGVRLTQISVDQRPRRIPLTRSLDASSASELEATLARSECCVVACRDVTAVDADVLRAFVLAHERVEARGSHLIFLGLHGAPLEQVRLRCLDEILRVA